jgi:hypothetical protein
VKAFDLTWKRDQDSIFSMEYSAAVVGGWGKFDVSENKAKCTLRCNRQAKRAAQKKNSQAMLSSGH